MRSCSASRVQSSYRQWFPTTTTSIPTTTKNLSSSRWRCSLRRCSSKPSSPPFAGVLTNASRSPWNRRTAEEATSRLTSSCVLRSFLKLYTTMPVAKLAGFLDMTEQEFRIQLLVFKHKMKNLVWTSGISALDGEFQSASEVDFYIDKVSEWTVKPFVWI